MTTTQNVILTYLNISDLVGRKVNRGFRRASRGVR
jgi:hypothetical protein